MLGERDAPCTPSQGSPVQAKLIISRPALGVEAAQPGTSVELLPRVSLPGSGGIGMYLGFLQEGGRDRAATTLSARSGRMEGPT